MPPRTKCASRAHRAQIRTVLLRDWDPIGVQDVEEAQDEYDPYIPKICLMLLDGADEAAIAAHLRALSLGLMGLSPHPDLDEAAAALVRLRTGFHLH